MNRRLLAAAAIVCFLPAAAAFATYCGKFTGSRGPPPPPPGSGGPVAALSCNFFVSPTGSDANNGTSRAAPFQNLSKAQTAMQGATAASAKVTCLMAGTFNITSAINLGTTDASETWEFDPQSGVNTATVDGGGTTDIFTMNGTFDSVTWNGIRLQNPKDFAIGSISGAQANLVIQNNDIGHNHDSNECCGGFAAIVTLSPGHGPVFVYNNYVHDTVAQGITIYAFDAGDTFDGTVVQGNVVLNACKVVNDCGGIYMDSRFSNTTAGKATIQGNFIRDYGTAGVQAEGIYLDDDTSNVTVQGNVVGPTSINVTSSWGETILNGGCCNTIKNNIFDQGASGARFTATFNGPGDGGAINFTWNGANTFFNNIVLSNFQGQQDTTPMGQGNFSFLEGGGYNNVPQFGASFLGGAVRANMYKNYGGGSEFTNGNIFGDASPTHADPLCSGYLYALSPTSPAFAQINFQPISTNWGPPGFVVPTSTNHSCPASSAATVNFTGYWFWGFSAPSIATVASNAPRANYMSWFSAVGTGGGGHLTFSGVGTPSVIDISAWKTAGKTVVMDIGGSASDPGQPAAIALLNSTDLANMEADIVSLVGTYGFQGIDMDLEGGTAQWSQAQMAQLFADMKSHFGAGFIVGIDPAPFEIRPGGVYANLYAAAGPNIDLVTPQWYSQCGQSDLFFINSYILPDLATITGTVGVPSSKIMMGASDNNGNCGAPGGFATYQSAWNSWKSNHPTLPLKGMMWWHTASDAALGYAFGQGFAP